jgi:hypothetical protein
MRFGAPWAAAAAPMWNAWQTRKLQCELEDLVSDPERNTDAWAGTAHHAVGNCRFGKNPLVDPPGNPIIAK